MNLESLFKKESKFAHYEYHLKINAAIDEKKLFKIGARKLGTVHHKDKYYINKNQNVNNLKELIRLRSEGDKVILFTFKGILSKKSAPFDLNIDSVVSKNKMEILKKNFREVIEVNKKRTIFIKDSLVINIDHVEGLGDYIEFEVSSRKDKNKVYSIIKELGLNNKQATELSYFELALVNQGLVFRLFDQFYKYIGKFSHGIYAAVLTSLGVIIGLNSALVSSKTIVFGLMGLAIADSLSHSLIVYQAKKSEREIDSSKALIDGFYVFVGELVIIFSFIVPFVLLPIKLSIYLAVIWGLFLVIIVNTESAFIKEKSIIKEVAKDLVLLFVVIAVTALIGNLMSGFDIY